MPSPLDYAPDDADRPFWEACRRHEFLLQRCRRSGRHHWPAVSEDIRVAMPAEVVFDDVDPETTLPRFRTRSSEES